MDNFNEVYRKWRKVFHYVALLIAGMTLAIELIVFFVLIKFLPYMIKTSIPSYILFFILVPSVINFTLVIIGRYSLSARRLSEQAKNYISMLILSSQCCVIACIHNVFTLSVCILYFPIFVTIIFSDKKMTKTISLVTVFYAIISFIFSSMDSHSNDPFFIIEVFVAFLLLLSCYITTILLENIEVEKSNLLKASFSKQLHLEELLKCDPLTGLYNMTTFYNTLEDSIKNNEMPLSIAVVDVDDFKAVNDTWGHERGNDVLIYLASLLQLCCNTKGHVFRYGGEEFTIIFPRTTTEQAKNMIQSAHKKLYHHTFDYMPDHHITFSCGIAAYPSNAPDAQDYFEIADKIMYQAKMSGKDTTLIG